MSLSFVGSFMAEPSCGAIGLYVPLQRSTRLPLNSSSYSHRLDAEVESSLAFPAHFRSVQSTFFSSALFSLLVSIFATLKWSSRTLWFSISSTAVHSLNGRWKLRSRFDIIPSNPNPELNPLTDSKSFQIPLNIVVWVKMTTTMLTHSWKL